MILKKNTVSQASIQKFMARKEEELSEEKVLANLVAKTFIAPNAIEKSQGLQFLLKKTFGKIFSQYEIWSAIEKVNADIFTSLKSKNTFQ